MAIHIDDEMHILRAVLDIQNQRRERECKQLAEKITQIPVPDQLLKQLCELGLDFSTVISFHPGCALEQKINSLWSVLKIFHHSFADLRTDLQKFYEYSRQNKIKQKDPLFEGLVSTVVKDVFIICSAASALKDQVQRIRKFISKNEYKNAIADFFDPNQHQFVVQLRNMLTHELFWNLIGE
ncbi:MAG TPA: hypothetical protein VHA06_17000 [Candidatus Angelobacter sp.]|nr:hypothetical protein [Candidatus Angelobacter sp.]